MTAMTTTHDATERPGRTARFWDRIADRYARKPITDEAAYQRKLAITRDHLRPDMEVLEIGCGTGSTALLHAPRVRHILAIDISARMVEIARGKAAEAGVENVTFRCAAFDDLAVPEGSLDAVLGLSILHLLDDPREAVARVHRLLKPGGVFVSNTACIGDRMPFFKLVAPLGRALGLLPLLRVFTSAELKAHLAACGFETAHESTHSRGMVAFIVSKKPG